MARAQMDGVWEAVGAEKREAVKSLFGNIAGSYDFINSAMSFRLHHRWRAAAVRMLELSPGDRVADVCCGTGDFVAPLRKSVGDSGRILGLDFCIPMLGKAREKGVQAQLFSGDACALPLASASFDAVTVGWGLRNVSDLDAALREVRRILKPGGRFVSVDTAKPTNALVRFGSGIVVSVLAPSIGALFGNREAYKYLPKSTDRFASREDQVAAMLRAGFVEARTKDLFLGNICIHWGKA